MPSNRDLESLTPRPGPFKTRLGNVCEYICHLFSDCCAPKVSNLFHVITYYASPIFLYVCGTLEFLFVIILGSPFYLYDGGKYVCARIYDYFN
jgi:hypothetical protein